MIEVMEEVMEEELEHATPSTPACRWGAGEAPQTQYKEIQR